MSKPSTLILDLNNIFSLDSPFCRNQDLAITITIAIKTITRLQTCISITCSAWVHLPVEIWSHVLSSLSFLDKVCLVIVCQSTFQAIFKSLKSLNYQNLQIFKSLKPPNLQITKTFKHYLQVSLSTTCHQLRQVEHLRTFSLPFPGADVDRPLDFQNFDLKMSSFSRWCCPKYWSALGTSCSSLFFYLSTMLRPGTW